MTIKGLANERQPLVARARGGLENYRGRVAPVGGFGRDLQATGLTSGVDLYGDPLVSTGVDGYSSRRADLHAASVGFFP